ncbi:unnamed protein product [Closterium sp. NIES-54]
MVGVVAQPAFPPSTSSSTSAILGRLGFVGVLDRSPTSSTTATRLDALPRLTPLICRGDLVRMRQELRGLLASCITSSLIMSEVR